MHSSWLGSLFDPYIELQTSGQIVKQYFERRVAGRRTINISGLRVSGADRHEIKWRSFYSRINTKSCKAWGFSSPKLSDKKILVIAPHADDAELAAFGLYSENNSQIVTITAGETDAQAFQSVYSDQQQASVLKGRLRTLDSITAALWAGLKPEQCISLGYFCQTLQMMSEQPTEPVKSRTAGLGDTRVFRQYNSQTLPSDQDGLATWNNLLQDLQKLIIDCQPDIIITPHPQLDPHSDHIYATRAVLGALKNTGQLDIDLYLYANHFHNTDLFPFGAPHSTTSLPPWFDKLLPASIVSYPVNIDKQKDKIFALEIMHDLKPHLKWKKKFRRKLQAWLIKRPLIAYGEDDYFRKAIRSNELFFRVSARTVGRWMESTGE